MGAAPLVVATFFALGPLGNVDFQASVRTTSNVRLIAEQAMPGQPGPGQDRSLAELGFTPRLVLMNDARLRITLAYAPSLRVPYASESSAVRDGELVSPVDHTTLLHNADLRVERAQGKWTLRSRAAASYGALDPFERGTTPGQPAPAMIAIPYQAFVLGAGFTTLPSRRVSLTVDAFASMSGGRGETAVQTLPLQQELRLDSALDFAATPRTSYTALLSFAGARVDRAGDAAMVRAGGRWTRSLTRRHTLRLSAGAATALERTAPGEEQQGSAPGGTVRSTSNTGPWAQASLAYTPLLSSIALTAGAEPAIDRLSGAVDYRGYLEASSAWSPLRDWRLDLSGYAAVLEPWLGNDERQADRTWLTELRLRVSRNLGRYVTLGAGVASRRQDSGRADLVSFREFVGMLEMNATTSP